MAELEWIIVLLNCGIALFFEIYLLIDSNSFFVRDVDEIKYFHSIVYAGLFQTIAYLIEFVLYEVDFFDMKLLGMFMESMIYVSNMLYVFAFAGFIYSKYADKINAMKVNRLLFLSPAIVLIILDIVNIFYPIFFNLTEGSLDYIETSWVHLVNAVPVLYILVGGVCDVQEMKKNSRYNSIYISMFFIPGLLGMAIEEIYSTVPVVPSCCALALLIMYMSILKRIGYIDSLSGLYNKSQLEMYIKGLLHKLPSGTMLAGIMIDVNKFKEINDTYGHVVGDRAIRIIGEILKRVTDKNSTCFRYGGDEFVIITIVSDIGQIDSLINRVNMAADEFNENKTEVFNLNFAQGYAVYDVHKDDFLSFVDRMDDEMYKNKRLSQREV